MTLNRRSFLFLALLPPLCGGADLLLPGLPPAGAAWAKDGRGGGDDDDDGDSSGHGGGDDDGGDDDNSGHGSGDDSDDDDDNSGSGSDDDDDDDNSGSDDDDDDDSSGSGSGGGSSGGGSSGSSKSGSGNNRGDALPALKSGLRRVYGDGREERISGGVYERRNAAGRVTERRAATSADRQRLASLQGKGLAAVVDVSPGRVTVTDRAGWREEFRGSTYRLIDPRGNLVTRRGITRKDIAHLRDLLSLR